MKMSASYLYAYKLPKFCNMSSKLMKKDGTEAMSHR